MGKRKTLKISLLKQPSFHDIGPLLPREEKEELNTLNGEIHRKRGAISKKNTSLFFTQLYQAIYGGKIRRDVHGDFNMVFENRYSRTFAPDITSGNGNGKTFTEVKANSLHSSSPYCSVKQIENYCCSLLKNLGKGDSSPQVDYAFFRYGTDNTRHLEKLSVQKFVEQLSSEKKTLTIVPINLLFFLFAFSKFINADQTSSIYHRDSQVYARPSGFTLGLLHREENAIQKMIQDYLNKWNANDPLRTSRYSGGPENLSDFSLQDLTFERNESSPFNVSYCGKMFPMESFSIAKYSLPKKPQKLWLSHFSKNHGRILENLGLEDIFADDIPFEK